MVLKLMHTFFRANDFDDMVLGIGIDIIEIERIKKSIERYGKMMLPLCLQ